MGLPRNLPIGIRGIFALLPFIQGHWHKPGTVPLVTVNKILRKLFYTGDFVWKGKTYRGTHEPLICRELWDRVQETLDRNLSWRHRKVRHDFAFSGLVSCAHCGGLLIGEIKKGATSTTGAVG